jgi:hypothetical protein
LSSFLERWQIDAFINQLVQLNIPQLGDDRGKGKNSPIYISFQLGIIDVSAEVLLVHLFFPMLVPVEAFVWSLASMMGDFRIG